VSSSVDAIARQSCARISGLQLSLACALHREFHAAASGDASALSPRRLIVMDTFAASLRCLSRFGAVFDENDIDTMLVQR
jgi:hypothetical protein